MRKVTPPTVIIEEQVLTKDYWREKTESKHVKKIQKELCLKLFHKKKKLGKREAIVKAKKKQSETSAIMCPVDPTKTAEETTI